MDVPTQLATLPQWINWRNVDGRKIPYQPNGWTAKTNDPATWTSLATAQSTGQSLGFVFAENDGLFGLDLDGCRNPVTGEIDPWAIEILDRFGTYAEVSPSGTGVKLWGRGKLSSALKVAIDQPNKHGKQPGIEAYDQGRYFAFTGDCLISGIADCQQQLDELVEQYKPTPTPQVTYPETDVERRAALFLDRCKPAISGQSGHNYTYRVAICLVRGFGLSVERARPLFEVWNQTCQPPWSDKEIDHKLQSAEKAEGERGFLLDSPLLSEGSNGVNLDQLLASFGRSESRIEPVEDPEEVEEENPDPGDCPEECLRPKGLLSDIVEYNLSNNLYPQHELALAGAIAFLGVLTGRKIRDQRDTRTNVLVMSLARSGVGKDASRRTNKKLAIAANCLSLVGPDRVSSHAGIVSTLGNNPATLFQIDEFHAVTGAANHAKSAAHLRLIPEIIKEAYSSVGSTWKPTCYGDSKQDVVVNDPHLVLYAVGVPEPFWDSVSIEMVTGGFLGRSILFDLAQAGYPPPQDIEVTPPQPGLVEQISWWHEFTPGRGDLASVNPDPVVFAETPEAKERFFAHMEEIRQRQQDENHLRASLWGRAGQKTAQLALIHAASRQTGQNAFAIDLCDLEWAIRLNNWSTRKLVWRAEAYVAESAHHRLVQRILGVIPFKPGSMSMSAFTRKTGHIVDRLPRERILRDLIEGGRVVVKEVPTKGRTKTTICRPTSFKPPSE